MLGAGPPNVDLKHLTEEERDLILSVLKRDEDLHSRDQQRVEALRCDIAALKQKSALRPGDGDADKTCSRCRKPFGWFFDKGEMCPKCKHKVCEACRVQMEKGSTKWNCILCQKQRELNAMSGQWFFSKFRKSKRDRKTKKVISGTELVRQSFKRPPPERRPNGASRQDERSWARAGARVRASESGDETSDTQSAKDMAMGRRPRKVAQIHDAAFPKDAERIMLLDLLGGPAPELSAPSQPQVDVRRVSARRYASGSSSDSDRDSAPSSPQLSQRTLSDYAPSDSVRSSFRSTSAASDGRITLVTDQSGVSDVSSPASLQHSPALSNASSIEQSHQHYMQVTSPPHNRPPDHRDRFQYEPRNRHTAHQNSSLYAPTSPVGPTGKSPLPTPRRSHQQQRAQPSGRSALNHPTHSGDWEPPAQQPRHPRLQPDSSPRKSDSKSSADSAIDNPSHFSTSSLSEEAPPGSQGAHTQVERGARSASSSSNEDVSTHRALQEMAQPVKQQAPPPPKPARMRTASSSSEAERLRGELEYYDMKDGTESSADSASTLTGGLDTGEYHVTNANSAPTTGSVANGKAEAVGEVEPNTDPELMNTGNGEGSLVTSSSPEVSSSCSIPAPMPSPGGGGEGEEGQTEDPGSPLRSLETEFTVENASRVSSHNERLSSVAVGTPSLRRQLAVSSSTPPTPPSPTPAQPFATPTSPASNRVHARHKRGLISRLSPSLAREGAGRNSLERQRRVDENEGPARASSRAMTEAERAVFLSHLPSSVVAEARPRSAVLEAQPAAGDGEDIDALVAAHRAKSVGNLCHPAAAHRSNLLTPFSASVESVTSFYSDAGEGNYGRIPVSGEIEFGLDYNYKVGSLEVRVKQCRDIAVIDSKKKRTDPSQTDTTETGEVKETEAKKPAGHVNTNVYVKTYLLPDKTKSGKRKTRVKKHTTNPVFNELLKYTISKSELETRTLWVTVWHNDTFGRNDFLGEVTMPLDYYEFKDPAPKWHKLQERNAAPLSLLTYKGDVSLQLKYVSAEHVGASRKVKGKTGVHGELHVLVKQARHLTAVRANGSSDPFCKAYLLPEKGKGSKQKSPVVRKNCNPQWRHTFVFEEVGGEELRECALELTIWDHDRFVSNDFLGGVRLSLGTGKSFGKEVEWSDSKAEEISLWQSMLDRPNHWVEATLLLRPNMDPRKAAA